MGDGGISFSRPVWHPGNWFGLGEQVLNLVYRSQILAVAQMIILPRITKVKTSEKKLRDKITPGFWLGPAWSVPIANWFFYPS